MDLTTLLALIIGCLVVGFTTGYDVAICMAPKRKKPPGSNQGTEGPSAGG